MHTAPNDRSDEPPYETTAESHHDENQNKNQRKSSQRAMWLCEKIGNSECDLHLEDISRKSNRDSEGALSMLHRLHKGLRYHQARTPDQSTASPENLRKRSESYQKLILGTDRRHQV